MSITRFEDIEAWQFARELCNDVWRFFAEGGLSRDFPLRDQMSRSSGSVMDNMAEGFDSGTNPEFVRFLRYAARSCSELQSQLYRALDRKHISQTEFDLAYEKAFQTRSRIGGFIRYLEKSSR